MTRASGWTNDDMVSDEKRLGVFARSGGYVLCLLGFVLTLVAFSPGLMSADSVDQWRQGREWSFYDVHPPLMSALWGLFDRVWPGPLLMLVFHNLLFWGGAALFWRLTRGRARVAALAFAAFGFMPQVWAILPAIWKDVGLGASLLLASGLLYAAARKNSRAALLASCPLMFYGYGVRLNAATAVLPLALWSGVVACRVLPALAARARARRVLWPAACGLVYFVALTLAVSLTSRALVAGHTIYPYQQVLLHDLAAISKATGEEPFPAYVSGGENFTLERVWREYSPASVNSLIYSDKPPLKITAEADKVAELRGRWREAVSAHTSHYLRHRWAIFATLTGFDTEYVSFSFFPATGMNNPRPIKSPYNVLTRALTSYFFYFSRSVFFRGFFWVMVAAALVYLSLRLRLEGELEPAFVLAVSGLLYALGYFFYTPSAEFRYLWWTVLAASASAALFAVYVVANWRRLRGRPPAPDAGGEAAAGGL